MTIEKKKVVAVLSDLMFTVKIQEAALRAGVEVVFVKSLAATLEQAKGHPAAILIDLNDSTAQPLEIIAALKEDAQTAEIGLVGFVSHVQAELIHAAREKGCETVMARSAFSQNLTAILQRYANQA